MSTLPTVRAFSSPATLLKTASSVLVLAAIAVAQSTAVIPNPAVFPGGGNSANIWRAGTNRVQCFYDSSNWAGQGIGQPIASSTSASGSRRSASFMSAGCSPSGRGVLLAIQPAIRASRTSPPR